MQLFEVFFQFYLDTQAINYFKLLTFCFNFIISIAIYIDCFAQFCPSVELPIVLKVTCDTCFEFGTETSLKGQRSLVTD